jgi:4-diphosphocytidyl-2-C-methyl-D-erythritol kinase
MESITVRANAKINKYLDIVGKRPDGYHSIVTEMQEIDLHDIVTVKLTDDVSGILITCDNPDLPTCERNIAYKAAELFPLKTGVEISIQKRIPVMAGLGGSSTDGAAALIALNKLHGDMFTRDELLAMGSQLGADVPFCLVGGRAKCTGIGDEIESLPDLDKEYYVIIQPDFCCNTRRAYRLYRPKIERVSCNIFHDLYNLSRDYRVDQVCEDLLQAGAAAATLTGSGSAVFSTFPDSESAESVYRKLEYPYKTIASNVRRNGI